MESILRLKMYLAEYSVTSSKTEGTKQSFAPDMPIISLARSPVFHSVENNMHEYLIFCTLCHVCMASLFCTCIMTYATKIFQDQNLKNVSYLQKLQKLLFV